MGEPWKDPLDESMKFDQNNKKWIMMLNHLWRRCGELNVPMPTLRKEPNGVTAFLFEGAEENALQKFRLLFQAWILANEKVGQTEIKERIIRCVTWEEATILARLMEGEDADGVRLGSAERILRLAAD